MPSDLHELDPPFRDQPPYEPDRRAHPLGRRFDGQQPIRAGGGLSLRRPPGCRKIRRPVGACSAPGFGECIPPADAVGDDVQHALGRRHVIRVAGETGSQEYRPGSVAGDAERFHQPGPAVAAVIGQRLARPLARDQDAAAPVPEVFTAMGFALAVARTQARVGFPGLDAVAQPVRAGGGAGLVPECGGEPFGVLVLGTVAVTGWASRSGPRRSGRRDHLRYPSRRPGCA